jgi:threonine dehydrogenase-like Zn-dependent dehydrogenase
MKALTYHGSKDLRVETMPDPTILAADDVLLRVTATAICGSDLHLYHGKIPETEHGDIFGHEFMGVVEEAGPEVTNVAVGDRVVIPFVIACGKCFFCENDLFAACEATNPDQGSSLRKRARMTPPAALFGYSHLYGGVPGGQAEFVRVPKANVGPFKVPGSLSDERVLFLSDILPTGYQAVLNAKIERGSTVAIFGAGPVGLMAAACAKMLGAERVFMVDEERYRLDFAVTAFDVIPVDFSSVDPSEFILEQTAGRGVDASIDAVGFEAKGSTTETVLSTLKLETSSGEVLRQAISATRRGGVVSIPGVYAGFIHAFLIGDAFDKGLTLAMGQTHVQKYLRELLEFIEDGKLQPDIIISHRMKLADAARGYEIFDKKEDDCRKVVLTP